MFYDGDLQSGIGKAVSEDKLVACFVTDDGEEGVLWESDFLQEPFLKSALSDQTILLRLVAGSAEAGYLAAIFPLPKTPTLVMIKNGELREYLASGVSKPDFMKRMSTVLGAQISTQPSSSASPTASASTTSPSGQTVASQPSSSVDSTSNTLIPSSQRIPDPEIPSPNVRAAQDSQRQAVIAERSARLEAQKNEQNKRAKEKLAAEAESKARQEAAEKAAKPAAREPADAKYAAALKKKQYDAKEDRARILQKVEDDKIARREKEAQRRAEAKAKLEEESAPASTSAMSPPLGKSSAECAVQIRLFDGSTIRSRFPSQGSLSKDVRPWIDGKQLGDVPYTFKQVLSPLPNKDIEMSEEERTLQSLGLTPSATLILLPVTNATNAYTGGQGLVGRGVSAGYGIVSSGIGLVTGVLGSFLGAGTAQPVNDTPQSSATTSSTPSARFRTLRDQNSGRDDQQFYNGNALNFEPRPDDENRKDD